MSSKQVSGNELSLMLQNRKQMAVFYRYTFEKFDEFDGQPFKDYVKNGTIDKRRFFIDDRPIGRIVYTTFTKPDNTWRSYVYKALKKSDSWSKDMDRIEKIILGTVLD